MGELPATGRSFRRLRLIDACCGHEGRRTEKSVIMEGRNKGRRDE